MTAANMQGVRSGVATQIKKDNPALPVHCFAHSLNLCLQDAERKVSLLRNVLLYEISKLLQFSLKRIHNPDPALPE